MNSSELPIEISDSEDVIRALKYPYHVKKNGRIKMDAFQPPKGADRVSVIRGLMGDDFCHSKAREICHPLYWGRATLNVGAIRHKSREIDVIDDRAEYLGHAHIVYLDKGSDTKDHPSAGKMPIFQYLAEIARVEKD